MPRKTKETGENEIVKLTNAIKEVLSKNISLKKDDSKKSTSKKKSTKSASKKASTSKTASAKKASASKTATAKKASTSKTAATKKASTSKTAATKKASTAKKTTASKTATAKKASASKTATAKKATTSKTATAKKASTSKTAATKKATASKTATAKKASTSKTAATKKASAKKASTAKTAATKKASAKKASTAKTAATKKASAKKASTSKTAATKKASTSKTAAKKVFAAEYYDLPFRYNQTVVKILAQTPKNLFIYWEISDEDRLALKKQYGEYFFEITKPVLIVYNETLNYTFEVEIDDFANSWYLHVDDSNSEYKVELGRRPIPVNYSYMPDYDIEKNGPIEELKIPYFYISSSNELNAPNDRILFNKISKVYFRNVKTNELIEKDISDFPNIYKDGIFINIYKLYQELYKEEIKNDSFNLLNPSSGNVGSGSFSSRFY
ncbi:MAG: DUF4912 domain-containing protein [Clostridia bacterium]|nr:DUF4912 domain-containing protein [Clostridia bacterium]